MSPRYTFSFIWGTMPIFIQVSTLSMHIANASGPTNSTSNCEICHMSQDKGNLWVTCPRLQWKNNFLSSWANEEIWEAVSSLFFLCGLKLTEYGWAFTIKNKIHRWLTRLNPMVNHQILTYPASQQRQKHSVMDAAMNSLEAYSEIEDFLCQLARTLQTDSSSGIT